MTVTETEERYIDKVMKLIAKAESTTPEEAEALMAKAHELMTRFAIDEAMLAHARGVLEPDVVIEHRIHFSGIYSKAHRDLMFAVARGSQFKTLVNNISGTSCYGYWIGFKRDVAAAELLLTSLLIQAERFQRDFMKEWVLDYPGTRAFEKFVARRSFLEGFATGISSRLVQARMDATKQAEKDYEAAPVDKGETSISVALVLADKQRRVQDWYDERYGKLRAGRARSTRADYNASGAGRSAAGRANLGNPGVGGSRGALGR